MQRITSATAAPLFDIAATRRIERAAAAALPPHTLMRRAGLAVARLAMALAPHARTVWIACGPGNNGGDGLVAAAQLRQRGFRPVVTWLGDEARLPPDARASLVRARAAGVVFGDAPPTEWDLGIDALLGIGAARAPEGALGDWLRRLYAGPAPVLAVDVPTGLDADTGHLATDSIANSAGGPGAGARFCLSLLTLKPGLFTASGRDAAGQVWLDDLGCGTRGEAPAACLPGAPAARGRPHASHKGSYGDVAVIGGAPGMRGAALLAASAALHAGAGRVYVAPLGAGGDGGGALTLDPALPELMFRAPDAVDLKTATVVCGCGGGDVVAAVLPRVLTQAARAVLDADALNAIAADADLQRLLVERGMRGGSNDDDQDGDGAPTVLTPHPLEAARLLGSDTQRVQADRLGAARCLARRFRCTVVLKGSGTVVAAPGHTSAINPTGNARLATAGTGDVLAGMVGARLAARQPAWDAACAAVYQHGLAADRWLEGEPLTAGRLARAAGDF